MYTSQLYTHIYIHVYCVYIYTHTSIYIYIHILPFPACNKKKILCAFLSTLQTTVRDLVRTYRELYAAMSLES